MKILVQVASSPRLLEEPQSLDALFATEGWQTFMTIVRESARTSIFRSPCVDFLCSLCSVAPFPAYGDIQQRRNPSGCARSNCC